MEKSDDGGRITAPPCDCLYLDMNGLIHRASHNGGLTIQPEFKDIIVNLFRELDYIVDLIKPSTLLFIAVDGCAPRAKLNQQRSRRYRSVKEKKEALESSTIAGDDEISSLLFDSNSITPGTEFMANISRHLQWFIRLRVKSSPLWMGIKCLYSGVEVPGEGEHKIMDFIRSERSKPEWMPNLRHCINGADADLIMLSLATHEPFFYILREVQTPFSAVATAASVVNCSTYTTANYQIFRSNILREHIICEVCQDMLMEEIELLDKERVIDDFVFLTFFIGNDFLPHHLDVKADGAYDILFDAYKTLMHASLGYIIDKGNISDLPRLQELFSIVGSQEESLILPKIASRRLDTTESARCAYYRLNFDIDVHTDEGLLELEKLCTSYLEGLIWCVGYYTKGCISWSWYYPFFHSPLLVDMINLERLSKNITFNISAPLTPFQQLLACLPPESSSLLPSCYSFIMTDPSSTLSPFFPPTTELVVDMTGKRNVWEGVIRLPFLPIDELLRVEALYCDRTTLSEKELERNIHKDTLEITYDEKEVQTVGSCDPSAGFSDITNCCTKVTQISSTIEPRDPFTSKLIVGTLHSIPGYPPLSDLRAHEVEKNHRGGRRGGGKGKGRKGGR